MDEDLIHIEFIYSDTCPDCPPAKEIVESVINSYDCLKVDYMNIKDDPDLIKKYELAYTPTIVINGKKEFVEHLTEGELIHRLEEMING
ncbi:MAG: thioredoxin family protein [Thermoplasmata archaeon]